MKLAGKIVFITGAASGIGKAQALRFVKEGAKLVATDINQEGLDSLTAEVESLGGEVLAIKAEVSDSAQVTHAVQAGIARFGQIDILCNTAGIFDNYATSLDTTEAEWDKYFAINVKGPYLTSNAVLPGMLARGKGIIINVCSIAGLTAGPGGSAYIASKHALVGYTKQLCLEFASKGIRVNGIAPGSVATPLIKKSLENDADGYSKRVKLIPANRLGDPEDIANLTVFLASDEADFIHGAILSVDGGRNAKG
jgi:3-oxoacyl-[acyl-carrier protein] reductase